MDGFIVCLFEIVVFWACNSQCSPGYLQTFGNLPALILPNAGVIVLTIIPGLSFTFCKQGNFVVQWDSCVACQTCLFFFFTNSFFLVPALFQTLCFREQDGRSQDPQGSLSVAAEWTVSRGSVFPKAEARTQAREGLYSCFLVSSARFLSVLSSALSFFTPLLHNIPHLVAHQHPPSWLLLDTRATCESGPGLHLSVHPICEYTSVCLEPC